MNALPVDPLRLILIDALSCDLMFVCKWWHEVITDMPQVMIQAHIDWLITAVNHTKSRSRHARDPNIVLSLPPQSLYKKMTLEQQIMLPTVLMYWPNHVRCRAGLYLIDYKHRMKWQEILQILKSANSSLSVYQIPASSQPRSPSEKYFTYMFMRYEQYRYHMMTIYPIDAPPGSHFDQLSRSVWLASKTIWRHYEQYNLAAISVVESEWETIAWERVESEGFFWLSTTHVIRLITAMYSSSR
jgi:hypothetical protein